MKAVLGALVVAAHAAGFVALAARCRATELAVVVHAAPASPRLALDGEPPAALADRVEVDDTPAGPGLHRRRWTVRYRGGVERSVGAVQLVGPFQDPAARRCVGRVVVGQRLLDDGHAGPGTVAAAMQRALAGELAGEIVVGAGELRRVDPPVLRWSRLDAHPEDRALVGDAPLGYVHAAVTLVFERVSVPIVVALVPSASPGELAFRIAVRAGLTFDNAVIQWISDKLGADRLATRLARRQLADALVTSLAPPAPITLPGGHAIQFTYCDEPPEIADAAYAAVPFAIAIASDPRDPRILPPRLGPGPRVAPRPTTALALDLDLDAVNALLYELWRSGELDRQLADAGLDRRFNADPTVAQLLSLRLTPPWLALPPVVSVGHGGLRLAAEARVGISDGATTTAGRVWGAVALRFAPRPAEPVSVALEELELSCERAGPPTTLVPCYGDLVAAMRGRKAELHGALTDAFARVISGALVSRFGAAGWPAELAIRAAIPTIAATATNASIHVELAAELTSSR
jgi:hypothetical protein